MNGMHDWYAAESKANFGDWEGFELPTSDLKVVSNCQSTSLCSTLHRNWTSKSHRHFLNYTRNMAAVEQKEVYFSHSLVSECSIIWTITGLGSIHTPSIAMGKRCIIQKGHFSRNYRISLWYQSHSLFPISNHVVQQWFIRKLLCLVHYLR